MSQFKVISTKKLSPSLLQKAMQHHIHIEEVEMIAVRPILSKDKWVEINQLIDLNIEHAVFTSAHAVSALAKYLNDYTSYHSINWKIFCLSGQTQKTLEQSSIEGLIIDTAENARSLAQKIIDHKIKELIFFCGNKRREELPALLQSNLVLVREVVVYETEEKPVIVEDTADGILFFSPSAVQSFFSANQLNEQTVCFAIGHTTAESIHQYTNNTIITSAAPSQEAILESVTQYFQNIKTNE